MRTEPFDTHAETDSQPVTNQLEAFPRTVDGNERIRHGIVGMLGPFERSAELSAPLGRIPGIMQRQFVEVGRLRRALEQFWI